MQDDKVAVVVMYFFFFAVESRLLKVSPYYSITELMKSLFPAFWKNI